MPLSEAAILPYEEKQRIFKFELYVISFICTNFEAFTTFSAFFYTYPPYYVAAILSRFQEFHRFTLKKKPHENFYGRDRRKLSPDGLRENQMFGVTKNKLLLLYTSCPGQAESHTIKFGDSTVNIKLNRILPNLIVKFDSYVELFPCSVELIDFYFSTVVAQIIA